MNRTAISLLVAAAVTLGAAPALAATNTLSRGDGEQLCTKLSKQFSDLTPFKEGLPYWKKASADFATGKQDCTSGKSIVGAQAMQAAISDLYVKPDTL